MNNQQGFTLIELMVTVAISAILLGIGVPSFRAMIQNNRIDAASNDLVSGLQLARSEAIKRGIPVVLCASSDQATCAATPVWTTGWVVRNQAVTTDPPFRVWPAVRAGIAITNPGNVEFSGLGSASNVRCFKMNSSNLNRWVNVGITGRIASLREKPVPPASPVPDPCPV
jgi:type IV fimbrial biogenesis protein FimT